MKYSVTFRPTAGMDYVTDETGKDLSPHEIAATIATLKAENARLRELLADAEKYLRSSGLDPEEADNLADEIRSLLISLEAE